MPVRIAAALLAVFLFAAATPAPPPSIPTEVNVTLFPGYGGNLVAADQVKFDDFSWRSFVALNQPKTAKLTSIKGDNVPRVWETWVDANDFFGNTVPLNCGSTRNGAKVLRMMAKNAHVPNTNDEFLEATGQPLIDQSRNFVLYEIRLNPDEVAYLKKYNLNTLAGQQAFNKSGNTISMPAGPSSYGQYGAMEVKAAWRIMEPAETKDFYTRVGDVYIAGENTVTGEPLCIQNVTLGLVGMHILHKTAKFTNWIWSSFEQNANTPNATNTTPSFYDTKCGNNCPAVNAPPALKEGEKTYKWDMHPPYAARYGKATQVLMANQLYAPTVAVTARWYKTPWVANSVWANYELIGSQWAASADAGFIGVPNLLANTTMETYIQTNSSCVICHSHARDTVGQCSDFSFALQIVPLLQGGQQGSRATAIGATRSKAEIRAGAPCVKQSQKP